MVETFLILAQAGIKQLAPWLSMNCLKHIFKMGEKRKISAFTTFIKKIYIVKYL